MRRIVDCAGFSRWQYGHAVSCLTGRHPVFPLFPAGEITLFARHDPTRVHNVEESQSDEHRQRVETILVCLVIWNGAVNTFGIFGNAEQNSQLGFPSAVFGKNTRCSCR